MNTIPHPAASAAPSTGAWDDVLHIVRSLGSTLDSAQLVASVRAILSRKSGLPVEVFLVEADRRLLLDPARRRETRYPDRLAAALQLDTEPVAVGAELDPGQQGSMVLGLRDSEGVVGVAVFAAPSLKTDPAWGVIAELCGSALRRAMKFDALARLTGDSEHTRSMQQQILDHVSHEFNTPLMILRSSADFARTGSEEERELFFDMHAQALDRLEQLVHGVIEVAHASARGDAESLCAEELVSGMVLPHFVDDQWPGGVPQLWHRASQLHVEVERESLQLAIEHLIRNAQVHAVPSGARVAVAIFDGRSGERPRNLSDALTSLKQGEVSLPPAVESPDTLFIEVIDDGPGVPAAELGLIFEPFTQASNSPIRGVSGAGMGLATATRLVETAGGSVEVESALGAGSIFRVRLPAR
jgi:signal transduction histidine kinase